MVIQFDNINKSLSNVIQNMNYMVPPNVGPVCVDIGASLGEFIIKYHSKFQHIYGLEPVYHTHRQCQKNLAQYSIQNATVFQCGITTQTEQDTIRLIQHNSKLPGNVTSSLTDAAYDVTDYEIAPAITMSHLLEFFNIQHIHYLKMGCEGCEAALLDTDLSFIDYLGIEIHDACQHVRKAISQRFDLIHQGSPHEFTYRRKHCAY